MKRFVIAATTALAWFAGQTTAADFDGSKLLICATTDAFDCAANGTCVRGRAEEIGAPTFIRVDFQAKTIIGANRSTPIVSQEKSATQLLLQGTEHGYAWSLALDASSGKMSASLVDRESVIVMFGACTPR